MQKKLVSIVFLIALIVSSVQSVRALEMERPADLIPIERTVVNHSSEFCASIGLGVQFVQCADYFGQQAISMNVSAAANTRQGINYDEQAYSMSTAFSWLTEAGSHSYQDLAFGSYADDAGAWVPLPLPFGPPAGMWLRFYGVDYKHVIDGYSGVINSSIWICTNGFVSFDISQSNATHADGIPSPILPNAVIAPLWTDLEVDEQSLISVRVPNDYNHEFCLAILWKNVRVKSDPGLRLTFTLGLEGYGAYLDNGEPRAQTKIFFLYSNVASIADRFTYGIEDHEGLKGNGESFANGANLGSFNNTVICFSPGSSGDMAYARRLKLTFADDTTGATEYAFSIDEGLRGNNLKDLNFSSPDMTMQMSKSYLSAANSIVGCSSIVLNELGFEELAGLLIPWLYPVAGVLLVWNLYDLGSKLQFNRNEIAPGWELAQDGPNAYVNASTSSTDIVDASLDVYLIWVLKDGYEAKKSHNLRIEATVEYVYSEYSLNLGTGVNIQVTPDAAGEQFETASRLQLGPYDTVQLFGVDRMLYVGTNYDQNDYYVISLKRGYNVTVTASPDPTLDVDLYLYSPAPEYNEVRASVSHGKGITEHIQRFVYPNESDGDWFFRTTTVSSVGGFYNMSFHVNVVGDIRKDGGVNVLDAIILSIAYGSHPGNSSWNPNADLNNDGNVNVLDAILVSNYFLQFFGDSPPSYPHGYAGEGLGKGMTATMEGTPSVSVDPSDITAFKGENITVNVKLTNVADLLGWEFKLFWNSTMLNCTSAVVQTPAEWQGYAQNYGPGLENDYNATHSRFCVAQSANYPAPSFNGSMTIATLTFQALQPGTTPLALVETNLGNSTADPIDHTESSGSVTVYYGRYMRSDTQQVNGLSAYKLSIPQSASPASYTKSGSGVGAAFGIRAWVRHSNGVEQEISLDGQTGTPKAIVGGGSGAIRSSTVSVAQTALQSTDSLVIRVYVEIADGPWNLCATFTTQQLQASTLKAVTWTVYYYTSSTYNHWTDRTTAKFYWGTTTYNSRIQNLQSS